MSDAVCHTQCSPHWQSLLAFPPLSTPAVKLTLKLSMPRWASSQKIQKGRGHHAPPVTGCSALFPFSVKWPGRGRVWPPLLTGVQWRAEILGALLFRAAHLATTLNGHFGLLELEEWERPEPQLFRLRYVSETHKTELEGYRKSDNSKMFLSAVTKVNSNQTQTQSSRHQEPYCRLCSEHNTYAVNIHFKYFIPYIQSSMLF